MKLFDDRYANRSAFQIADDLFDDRTPAVIGLRGQHRQRSVGDHRMVLTVAGCAEDLG